MIKHRDIRGFKADYHRNGVCGAGFWLCRFKLVEGRTFTDLQAVVFDETGHVAVTSDNPAQHYRGDDFEDVLRDAIARAVDNKNASYMGALP